MKKIIAISFLMSLTIFSFSNNKMVITKIECKDIGLWASIQHQNLLNILQHNLYNNKISAINSKGDNMMAIIKSKADTLYKSGQRFGIESNYEKLKKQEFDRLFEFYNYDSIVLKNDSLEFNEYDYKGNEMSDIGIYIKVSPQIRISLSEVLAVVDEDVKLYLNLFRKNNIYSRRKIHSSAINIIDEFNHKIRKLTLSAKYKVYLNDSFTQYLNKDSILYYCNIESLNQIEPSNYNIDSAMKWAKQKDSISKDLPIIFLIIETNSLDITGISASLSFYFGSIYIGKISFGYLKINDILKDQAIDWEVYGRLSRKALATKLMADYDNLIKRYDAEVGLE